MLFTVTTIRISIDGKFEATECNNAMLTGDLEKELISNKNNFSDLDKCLCLKIGESIELNSIIYSVSNIDSKSTKSVGVRITYVTKIN